MLIACFGTIAFPTPGLYTLVFASSRSWTGCLQTYKDVRKVPYLGRRDLPDVTRMLLQLLPHEHWSMVSALSSYETYFCVISVSYYARFCCGSAPCAPCMLSKVHVITSCRNASSTARMLQALVLHAGTTSAPSSRFCSDSAAIYVSLGAVWAPASCSTYAAHDVRLSNSCGVTGSLSPTSAQVSYSLWEEPTLACHACQLVS